MKILTSMAILGVVFFGCAGAVQAQGNPEEGESVFKKCKTCHIKEYNSWAETKMM